MNKGYFGFTRFSDSLSCSPFLLVPSPRRPSPNAARLISAACCRMGKHAAGRGGCQGAGFWLVTVTQLGWEYDVCEGGGNPPESVRLPAPNPQPVLYHAAGVVSAQSWLTGERLCGGDSAWLCLGRGRRLRGRRQTGTHLERRSATIRGRACGNQL
jgi:hypothetical protein